MTEAAFRAAYHAALSSAEVPAEPACAACGAGPADGRLGEAGSEYWPERRAELTCDACAERLTLAVERFRRVKGWAALQERLTYNWAFEAHARLREARP